MLIALTLLTSLFFITLLVYLKTTPEPIDIRHRIIFDVIIFALALLACVIIYAYTYLNNGLSIQRAVLSLLAYLQSLLAISMVLMIGGLCRNLIIFRKK
jgi:hypothetical protein